MALSLAACGGSDDVVVDITSDNATVIAAALTTEAGTSYATVDAAVAAGVTAGETAADAAIRQSVADAGITVAADATGAEMIAAVAASDNATVADTAKTTALTTADGTTTYATVDAAVTAGSNTSNGDAVTAALTDADGVAHNNVDVAITSNDAAVTTAATSAAETVLVAGSGFDTVASLLAAYNTAISTGAAVNEELSTAVNTVMGSANTDTVGATDLTYNSGDTIVDSSTTDGDTLTINAAADIAATPTVVGIENIVLNATGALSSGDTTFQVAMDNVTPTNISVDVTAASTLITDAQLDNVKSGANITLSDEFTTATIDGVDNGSYTINAAADLSLTVTGATVDDVTVVSAKDVTIAATSNDGDLTITGEVVGVTADTVTGALNVTSSDNTTITTADGATSAVINAAGVVAVASLDSATSINITTTGAEADAHNVLFTDSASTVLATSVTVVSAHGIGDATGIGTTKDAVFDAATTINVTVDESSAFTASAADAVITLASTEADADDLVTMTVVADNVASIAFTGSNDFVVSIDMNAIDTETVTNTNTGTSTIAFNTEDTNAAADLTEIATSVIMRLDDTMDASDVLTVATTGAQIGLDDATAQGGAFQIISDVTTATGNEVTLLGTNSDGTTGDEVSEINAAITVSHFATLNLITAGSALDATGVSIGGATNNELTAVNISGAEAVILDTVVVASGGTVNGADMTGALTIVMDATANVAETVTSGSGADNFTLSGTLNSGNAVNITSGDGIDTATMTATNDVTWNGGDGIDTLVIDATLDLTSNVIALTSVEQINITGTGDVSLDGSDVSGASYVITSDGGADALTIVTDATSTDLGSLSFATGFVAGSDTLTVDGSNIALAQTITGSSFRDAITTAGGDDNITGGAGIDVITGAGGNDTINLAETVDVADKVVFSTHATNGTDQINGHQANDTYNVKGLGDDAAASGGTAVTSAATIRTMVDNTSYVVTTNGAAGDITTAGTAVVTDFTNLTQVAAYLTEGFEFATAADTEANIIIINDEGSDNSYIYSLNSAAADQTIAASEMLLAAVIDNGGVDILDANIVYT